MRSYRRAGIAGAVAVVALFGVTSAIPSSRGSAPGAAGAQEPPFVMEGAGSTGGESTEDAPTTAPTTTGSAGSDGAVRPVKMDVKPLPAAQAIRELRTASSTPPAVTLDAAGHVRAVAAPAGKTLRRVPGAPAASDPSTQASAFLNRYGAAFGLRSGQQARRTGLETLPGGDKVVRFRQYAKGLPVLGGDLLVTVNWGGEVLEAVAETAATAPTSATATVSAAAAGAKAVAAAKDHLKLDGLVVSGATLWLYDGALIGAPTSRGLRPTWWVKLAERSGHAGTAASAYIDAGDGSVSLIISEHQHALNRIVCDQANASLDLNNPAAYNCSDTAGGPAVSRREGEPASAVADVNKAYDYLGSTYEFYRTNFGRDSLDGKGKQLRATVRACDPLYVCPFPNAFWDGDQMVFGQGYASADDVVAHELTHGVIDSGSQLLYAYQSGAINEALADIMGELLDQTNNLGTDTEAAKWLVGEDLPIGAIRNMKDPTLMFQPDWLGSTFWEPDPSFEDNGGVHTNSGVANKIAYLLGNTGTVTFRGNAVTGLGTAKSAQLWYRVLGTLTSGATYYDLGQALTNGCRRLVGYKGFTTTDCVQVDRAVAATGILNRDSYAPIAADSAPCPAEGQSTTSLFFDGFEGGTTKWQVPGPYWQVIPSADIAYRYARTGTGSLNGWTTIANGGNFTAAAMKDGVAIPVGQTTYLRFSYAMFRSHIASTPYVLLQYDAGSGWLDFTLAQPFSTEYQGYGSNRYTLGAFAGQTVKFRFLTMGTTGRWIDFYVDDFSIYQCSTAVGAPRSFAAAWSADGTSAQLDWAAPTYTGPGLGSYEISVLPAVGGAGPISVPVGTTSHALTGLDPAKRYRVTVRAIGGDGVPGPGVTLPLNHNPNIDCAVAAWVPDPATGRRVPPWPCPGAPPGTNGR